MRRVVLIAVGVCLLVEILLRLFGAFLVAPHHLTHGLPLFVDLRKGVVKMRPINSRPIASHYPYQSKLVPLAEGGMVSARINNEGFRGEDFKIEKPEGTLRIATLGASSTFGFGVKEEETYPAIFERLIAQECGKFNDVQVYNFGAPYQPSAVIKIIFEQLVLKYKPDIVTFYEGVNDAEDPPASFAMSLFHTAKQYFLSLEYVGILLEPFASYDRTDVYDGQERRTANFIENLTAIATRAAAENIRFIVMSQQAKSFILPRDQIDGVSYAEEVRLVAQKLDRSRVSANEVRFLRHADFMKALRLWVQRSGVEFLDIAASLDHKRSYLWSWVHLDRAGNRAIAEELSSHIIKVICESET